MICLLRDFLFPHLNRWILWGIVLVCIGLLFLPFFVGIPILGVGFAVFSWGVFKSFANRFELGRRLVAEFEKFPSQLVLFLKQIFQHNKSGK